MKKSQFILLIFLSLRISAQSWDWIKTYGTSAAAVEKGEKIGVDNLGNIYIKGSQTAYTGSGGSSNNISLIFKYNSVGTLLWVDTLLYDGNASIDGFGNTYIAANTKVAKYDNNGQFVWVKLFPKRNFTYVETARNGNIVVGGSTKDTFCTDSSAYYMLNPAGNVIWSRIGDFASQCGTLPFACDKFSNSYLLGSKTINGTVLRTIQKVDTMGSITGSFTVNQFTANTEYYKIDIAEDLSICLAQLVTANTAGNNTNTINIVKFSNNGNAVWTDNIIAKQGTLFDIEHDSSNNLYFLTSYRMNLQFQNTVLSNTLSLALIKTDASGAIIGVKETSGGYYGNISAGDMVVNFTDNKVYITGQIQATHNFDNYTITGNAAYPDMFLAKLNQAAIITGGPSIKKNEMTVNIYPTVTNDFIKIDLLRIENMLLTILITNSTGQVVYKETQKNYDEKYVKTFDMRNLSKGLYLIQVTTGEQQITKKVILE